MAMRIWYQGFLDYSTVPDYAPLLRKHVEAIAAPGTEVELHGMPSGSFEGTSPAEIARYSYLTGVYVNQLVDHAVRAEAEGFDAFAIGIVQNPGLRDIRTVVDIPVTGYGEAAMHLGCMLGRKFSVLAFNPELFELLEEDIARYGLRERAAPMTLVEIDYPDVVKGFSDPSVLVAAFNRAAKRAIDAGADVLIPGQMVLAELLWQAGVRRFDEAPVVDALAASINTAEMLVNLKRNSGVSHSRRGFWGARPPAAVVDFARRRYLTELPRSE